MDIRGEDRAVKIIDTKLPLTWLLTTGGIILAFLSTTLWNVSMQSNKLDQVVISTAKIEQNVVAQDGKLEKAKETIYAMQRVQDNQQLRIEALERGQKK